MKKTNYEKYTLMILFSAAVYILLDLPVRMTEFLEFGVFIGIKNFLPFTLGLLFGWYGTLGCLVGSILTSLITAATLPELLFEGICVLVSGMGMWLLWHVGVKSHRVHLKKAKDYFRYIVLTMLFSGVCGAISYAFMPRGAFATVFISYISMNLLVGIPVMILLTSIVCVIPVAPSWGHMPPDISGDVDSQPGSLDGFNDQLEEYFVFHKFKRKALYSIQNCIEEVIIRIFAENSDTLVSIKLYCDDSLSLWFAYEGSRYNPFVAGRNEESEDMYGLQLIKHRALRASYTYGRGMNQIHIVI